MDRGPDARAVTEQVVASWGRLAADRSDRLGPVHPETVDAREHHAYAHRWIGQSAAEVALVEMIAADHREILGATDRRTLHAQIRLASRYVEGAHDLAAAVALAESILDDTRTVFGDDHEDTRRVRDLLWMANRMIERTSVS